MKKITLLTLSLVGCFTMNAQWSPTNSLTNNIFRTGKVGIGYATLPTFSTNTYLMVNGDSYFSGKIGVGTLTPTTKLEINSGTTGISGLKFTNLNSSSSVAFVTYLNGFPALTAKVLTLDTNGNVVLGNSGSLYANNGFLNSQRSIGLNGFNINFTNETTTESIPETILFIGNSKNVGIGTITPDAKLAVNGQIHAKEVKVDLIGWPDYVFNINYDLPKLSEVENYIKLNKHLIDFPTASEIENDGLHLGEIIKIQQKKIEELTLYLIKQDKDINELKSLMIDLINKNN